MEGLRTMPSTMRTLFLDKPTSRITTRQWLLIGAALAALESAALAAYFMRPAPAIAAAAADPVAQCEARGAEDYRSRNEWPLTADGRDANALVSARCTLDSQAFPQVFR
jgi:hypothetical protein